MINMASIVNDPDLGGEVLTRIERPESLLNGRGVLGAISSTFACIVTSPSQQDVERLPAGTRGIDTIKVITTTKLNDDYAGRQPDIVVRNGTNYIVQQYNDYMTYGFNYAVCTMTDLVASG